MIAENLKISINTVDRHRSNLMTKLGLHSTAELVRYAIKTGII
jgi:DNA-binding NarL/FixJ family response regulator